MRSFRHARSDELEIGLAYALDKFSVELDPDTLEKIFNETGEQRLKDGCTFYQARAAALDRFLTRRDKSSQQRYKAYSATVGKIGNRRRTLSQRAAKTPEKLSTIDRVKQYVRMGNDNRQLEFIL